MHDETSPQFSLTVIQAAVSAGNYYYFMSYGAAGLVETQLTGRSGTGDRGPESPALSQVPAFHRGWMGRAAVRLVHLPPSPARPHRRAVGVVAETGAGADGRGPDLQSPLVQGAQMKCGRRCDGEYREVIEPQTFKVRGREVTVPVALLKCGACGDVMYSPEQADRAQNAVYTEIRRRENLLAPGEIASLRLGLGLKQEEFERLLGLGPKTVVRWESGRVFQQGRGRTHAPGAGGSRERGKARGMERDYAPKQWADPKNARPAKPQHAVAHRFRSIAFRAAGLPAGIARVPMSLRRRCRRA